MKLYIEESKTYRKYFTDSKGNLYYSDSKGFEVRNYDWNHDGDVYSIYGMWVNSIEDGCGHFIPRTEFDLIQISESKFMDKLHDILDNYFLAGEDTNGNYYYCDSTDNGETHYGYPNFFSCGSVIYGTPEDRETTIQKEIDFLLSMNELYEKPPKPYIKESISGRIEDTDERCIMRATGYWTGGGKRTTSYERVDKEVEYDDNGNPVKRQYSMDRNHRFWVETEDIIY